MCELFGFSAAKKTDISDYLKEFFAHSDKNPHGWGMMFGENREIVKGAEKAADSEKLRTMLSSFTPQSTTVAHIRFATVGSIKQVNCHPFEGTDISGRLWTMAHNGTVYSAKNTYRYLDAQQGDTDSERLFMAFLEMMNDKLAKGDLSERQRFKAVNDFITENAPRNKLNLILYDGDLMYAHKNLKNTLSYKQSGDGVFISTQPLDNGEWKPFPMAQVIAFRAGKEVYRGKPHKGIFVPTLEYITAMDAMNI